MPGYSVVELTGSEVCAKDTVSAVEGREREREVASCQCPGREFHGDSGVCERGCLRLAKLEDHRQGNIGT